MATAFPLDTYPLDTVTGFADASSVYREIMDDGTPAVRVINSARYRTMRCQFSPMTQTQAEALAAYMNANLATEFEFTGSSVANKVVTGYLWSDVRIENFEGHLARVSFDIYGVVS